ncbi:ABC transporter ATP-binding protein [Undibacterium flavidum]|uniref:ABC transporter ATP-binding protein n=1 Tax=Undibacterium flavidum TaxID=2762297 RepID=A0ABR6YCX2_9BURK|nr:ABC transporter ATP-binding protein [Undibacterium flavidum]MBC3874410.1 ABC transporter ATP-binding protein [Undibacterium flavidum]
MTKMLLEVRGVSKKFGQATVVDNISFSAQSGQTIGLLGPNGAGKSTTVNMICGLLQADSGQILISGQLMAAGQHQVKKQLGLVPQDLALFDDLSARENLKLFGALYGLSGLHLQQRCDAVLELVSLQDRAKDKPSSFSGGMKRRLNIAAALLHDPQLLILDEPTVGIDPQSRNAIFDALEVLKAQGRTLIYTSHYMEEVERLADHIVIIDHGKIIANETPAELVQRLPAQAALTVNLASALDETGLSQLTQQIGVQKVLNKNEGKTLELHLSAPDQAISILNFVQQQHGQISHFETAKTRLEDVFLTLTGRSLRD